MNPSNDSGPQSPVPAPAPTVANSEVSTGVQERAAPAKLDRLPPFRVLLHNDDVNDMLYVVEALCDITPLMPQRAAAVMMEAHRMGVSLVLTTHRERAELYVEQFKSKRLRVTIEPAE